MKHTFSSGYCKFTLTLRKACIHCSNFFFLQLQVLLIESFDFCFILELNPPPTEKICQQFNELRSDIVLHYELRGALTTCDYELQSLRHQYEALVPGKVSL